MVALLSEAQGAVPSSWLKAPHIYFFEGGAHFESETSPAEELLWIAVSKVNELIFF